MALEAARSGDPGPLWITAERQTGGRGRRDRPWVSEAGNLYATLLLVDAAPMPEVMNLPLVAALGVRNGLASLKSKVDVDVAIKWPNDILVNGRKSVGILLESERLGTGRLVTVIGCGVNVVNVPDDTPYPVTGLRREGVEAGVEEVFEAVALGVEDSLSRWKHGANFSDIRTAWLEHASGVGRACRVNMQDHSVDGIFEDLDDLGRLILKEPSGRRHAISSGDVFLLG